MTKHSHKLNHEEPAPVEERPAPEDETPEIPESAASSGAEAEPQPDPIVALEEAVAALTAERDALQDQLLRSRAEFDNYRKRMARQTEQIRKTAAEDLIRGLLPVVDNLERALSHAENPEDGLAQGVLMISQQFCEVLKAQGLTPIPALGEPFDPQVHEAMSHLPSEECPAGSVLAEYERGYRIGDYIVRPSKVVVSSGPPVAEEAVADAGEASQETTDMEGEAGPA
jgi:molecular chaperone GrpE